MRAWMLIIGAVGAQAAEPDRALSVADLRAQVTTFNAHATSPLPELSGDQLRALLAGDVVRVLDRPKSDPRIRRAVGLVLVEAEQRAAWVAAQDPHFVAVDGLTELQLTRDPSTGRASWYGHIDIPSPFDDRHYVVDVWNNHALHAASGGTLWEHAWQRNPTALPGVRARVAAGEVGALDVADFDASIETPLNEGAWIAMATPDGRAVLGYHATTLVGGHIPEGLFARYILLGLKSMMRTVQARAQGPIQAHYRGGHRPLPAGGPSMTPTFE